MTIGIALKYETGVVLGSDSQVTLGDAPYKTQGTKIEQIGNRVGLIAAGSIDFYKELVRRLKDHREEIDKSSIPTVTDLVSQSMADLYITLARRFGKQNIEEVVPLASVGILVAGVNDSGEPHVFTLRPPGIYGPEDRFGIVGSGIFYAGMTLKKRYRQNMRAPDAGKVVVRAIKETSEMDPYVDREINLSVIDSLWCGEDTPFKSEIGESYTIARYLEDIRDEDWAMNVVVDGHVPPDLKSQELELLGGELIRASVMFTRQVRKEREDKILRDQQ